MTTALRTMYDSVTASREPNDGEIYLYYADGIYANEAAVKADHPGKLYVGCAVRWTTRAQMLDVENGDATAAEAVKWCTITMADKQNSELTIYANTSDWPGVVAAFKAAGVTLPQHLVAQYDGKRVIPAGCIGKQYLNTAGFDESVVAAFWPGVDSSGGKVVVPVAPAKLADWQRQQNILAAVPEGVYEHYTTQGWDNLTPFGKQYGEDGVSWCVIFDWDVMADAGLAAVVPKTDNVDSFTAWAKARGEWSEYPSVGAWVNLDNGGHTETVTGFDATNVYTKGGNTIPTGATDNGTGYGVYSHGSLRAATRIVGYFAPKYPDGVCPPTADPHDYRGGKAVTSFRFTPIADPASDPQPKNSPLPEDDMTCIITYPKGAGWRGDFSFDGATLHHLKTPAARTALQALGVPVKNLNTANFNAMYAEYPHS